MTQRYRWFLLTAAAALNNRNKCVSIHHANILEYPLKQQRVHLKTYLKLIAFLLPKPNLASPPIYKQNYSFANFFDKPSTEKNECVHLAIICLILEKSSAQKCTGKVECFLLCDAKQQLKKLICSQVSKNQHLVPVYMYTAYPAMRHNIT